MDGGDDVEETVAEFVELESELAGGETAATGSYDRGYVAGATTVPAERVPDGYPVTVETERALRISVDAGPETVPVFLEWPGEGEQSDHVSALLDALGRAPDEFADVHGDEVVLTERDGWHRIDLDGTAALCGGRAVEEDRELRSGRLAVVAGVAASVLGALLAAPDTAIGGVGTLLQVSAVVGLPLAIYRDAGRVDERVSADRTTGLWALGAVLPVVNAVVGALYLVDRRTRLRGVHGVVPAREWQYVVGACVAATPFVALALVEPALGALAAATAVVGLPVAVYVDAGHVEAATDAGLSPPAWAIGSLVATPLLLGWLVGVVYLLRRRSLTG